MSQALPRSADDGRTAAPRANAVVAVLAFGGIVVSLMQTLVIPIVPELPRLLNAPASDTAWAVTATLLAAAVATPMTGRLGDMYGKRRMLLISLVMLVAGSVTAALSDSLAPMIVGRALQGLASGVIPLGISIMRDELPAERLGSATALMSASLGVGGALGLPAAALIADNFDWHALFWASAGLGVVALVLVPAIVPESAVRTGGRFDLIGGAGMAAGLVCLLLAISKGADWGWSSGTTLGLFAAAVVVLLVWGWWELRVREPLVDLRTTARRQVLVTNLASIAVGFAMFAMSLVIPQLLQLPEATGYGLGRSLLVAGLTMAPSGLVMMATAPVSAALSKARGPKITLMIGALVVAAGYGLNIVLMSEVWHFVLVTCVIGAGIGFTYGAMPALIMSAVPASETGAANSLNTLMRSIGTSTASAVAGVVLAQMTTAFGQTALPSQNGFRVVLAIGAGAALLAFAVASFIPRQRVAEGAAGAVEGATEAARATEMAAGAASEGPVAVTGIPVRGRVLGAERMPVAGAAVTLISLGGKQLGRAVSRDDGAYDLGAPGAGSYVLVASSEGCQPQASTIVVADEPVAYDVLLSGTSCLAGVVRSTDGGTPVTEAVVIVTDVRGDVLATARTDVLGEFTVTDLVPGPVTVAVNSPKHRPLAQVVEVGGAGTTRVGLELRPGAQVRGTVRGAGAPLSDARVTLVDAAGNVVATTRTGLDGAYAFSDLDTGAYTVIATGYPPQAASVTVSGTGVDDHDIELAHAGE
ncbi:MULTISPECIES: MFS transporter [Streptomyces]|uniref:Multidrug-efflux transporter 3 n=1 Tax=Streptomyces chartreusis NRRL 3882 TaxID=1079985 RepID=A0A2N9B8U6_STRCX|nr:MULTISPECIES: MFS transporter [Streptomyces]MYS89523.1 MFS transporter [Streptomyces sp. SID5464]SOR79773.1 Multidrug-efflux transporter 3 [Streptomyces chartreusis NRRL 3882]